MTRGHRVTAWLLLLAAIVLAIMGQRYFFYRREYLWDGLVLHGLAVACFLAAWRVGRPATPRVPRPRSRILARWLKAWPVPAALLAGGVLLSLAATLLSRDRPLQQPSGDVVLLWGLGTAAAGLAALWPASGAWRSRLLEAWESRWPPRRGFWLEVVTVAGLAAVALLLRVAALDRIPYTLGGDEAWHGLLARQVLSGALRNPFSMGYMSMPTFFYWPLSWSLWLVGNNMSGLRLPAALAGAATVPLLYLFARDLWGRRTAFLAALLLCGYDYHIHYSRLGANNIWDPLFVLLALWALDRGLARFQKEPAPELGQADRQVDAPLPGSRETKAAAPAAAHRSFLAAGMVMGLASFFYTGARLLPVLVVVYAGYVWLKKRRNIQRLGLNLALLALAFLICAGPMLGYALAHLDEWNARINQVGILQSGWLAREPGLTGKSTAQILAEQFLRSAGAFHVFADRTVWYGSEKPLLGFWAGLLAVLGMAWAVAHWRERRYFLVLLWFWSVIITGGMLTESPPSSQRLVIAIPAVVLLVAFGLEQVVRLAWRLLAFRKQRENVVLALAVLALAAGSVHYYFVEFSPARRYGSQNGETATMMGHYLHDLDGNPQVYLLGAPRIYWSFGTMPFLAPRINGQDVVEPLAAPPDFAGDGHDTLWLFLPERAGELGWVQQAFPDGQVQEFRDAAGQLRFLSYRVNQS